MTVEELWRISDAARHLGVSRQRVHQLSRDDPTFPPPAHEDAVGRLWRPSDIERWAVPWEQKRRWRQVGLISEPYDSLA